MAPYNAFLILRINKIIQVQIKDKNTTSLVITINATKA